MLAGRLGAEARAAGRRVQARRPHAIRRRPSARAATAADGRGQEKLGGAGASYRTSDFPLPRSADIGGNCSSKIQSEALAGPGAGLAVGRSGIGGDGPPADRADPARARAADFSERVAARPTLCGRRTAGANLAARPEGNRPQAVPVTWVRERRIHALERDFDRLRSLVGWAKAQSTAAQLAQFSCDFAHPTAGIRGRRAVSGEPEATLSAPRVGYPVTP